MLLAEAVAEYLDERARRGVGENSLAGYWSQLHLLLEWLFAHGVEHVRGVTPELLLFYVAEMRERGGLQRGGKLSPVTLKKRILFLRTFFGWLAARETTLNLAAMLEVPKKGRGTRVNDVMQPSEISQLLDVSRWCGAKFHTRDWRTRDYAILLLMLDAGLRLSEVCALLVKDVKLESGTVFVRAGKGDKDRWTVFSDEAKPAFEAWLTDRADYLGDVKCDAFFVTEYRAVFSSHGMYKVVKRRAHEAGVEGVNPHELRHAFFTEYLNAGGNIYTLKDLVGHEDIQTTMSYKRNALVPAQREHGKLSPLRHRQNSL